MDKFQIQFDSDGYHLYKVAWDRYLVEHEGDNPMLLGLADAKRWTEEHWPDRIVLIDDFDKEGDSWSEVCGVLQFGMLSEVKQED